MPTLPKDATHLLRVAAGEIKAGTPIQILSDLGDAYQIAKAWTIYGPIAHVAKSDLIPIGDNVLNFEAIKHQWLDLQGWKLKLNEFYYDVIETYVFGENVRDGRNICIIHTDSNISGIVERFPHPSWEQAFAHRYAALRK